LRRPGSRIHFFIFEGGSTFFRVISSPGIYRLMYGFQLGQQMMNSVDSQRIRTIAPGPVRVMVDFDKNAIHPRRHSGPGQYRRIFPLAARAAARPAG
jgi:hypothetical protein